MNRRETHDLLAIWIEHDTNQWTPEAFQAIREILTEQGVAVPTPGGTAGEQIRREREAAQTRQCTQDVARIGRGVRFVVAALLALVTVALIAGPLMMFLDRLELSGTLKLPGWLVAPTVFVFIGLWFFLVRVYESIFTQLFIRRSN